MKKKVKPPPAAFGEQNYNELVRSSRADFDARLNWDVWGATTHKLILELLEHKEQRNETLAAHHV